MVTGRKFDNESPTLSPVNTLGFDIGATLIKAARVDSEGVLLATAERPTASDQPDDIVSDVVQLARELRDSSTAAVGVAVAAFLSPHRDTIVMSPNISWRNRALRSELESAWGIPVAVENDANLAALGEYFVGAARGAHSLVMLTLGTGVGGGVIVAGKLLVGAHGVAAELGHIVVDRQGTRCGCGQYGCLETVASGSAIVQSVRQARGDPSLGAHDVEEILRGDAGLAQSVIDQVSRSIATALTSVTAVIDPEVVVLGGGVIDRVGSGLVDSVAAQYQQLVSSRYTDSSPRILGASLGNRAGLVGAALLAQELTRSL